MADLVPVKLPPGFFRNGTEYESAGRWYDGSLVRWHNGRLRPVGGWRTVGTTLDGKARGIISWRGDTGLRYGAIGTNTKLYVNDGGAYSDVSPADLVAGRADAALGSGYGTGKYGVGSYGTRRVTTGILLEASTWSFDTYDQTLLACSTADGRVLKWSPATGGLASVLSGAPTSVTGGVLMTDEDHLLALGPGSNRRKVQWSSQGDITSWTPGSLTTAGSVNLKTGGNIVCGQRVAGNPLIWTGIDVHTLVYLGAPLVYGRKRIAKNCGAISANCVAVDQDTAYWMSNGAFFYYDGLVRPLPCDVSDYVFGSFNTEQKSKVFASHNSKFFEVIWFYPSASATENDRYVVYNYLEKVWYFGTLSRTCWSDAGTFSYPVAVDGSGVVREHEYGFLADGAARTGLVFAKSGPAEIGNGDDIIYSNLFLPDSDNGSAITLMMKSRTAPGASEISYAAMSLAPSAEGYVPARFCGRQVSIRVDQTTDVEWSLGKMRFKLTSRGKR